MRWPGCCHVAQYVAPARTSRIVNGQGHTQVPFTKQISPVLTYDFYQHWLDA